jgi:dTDP-3-amino-3,4,6-trideoxy-alpha-D-glucose transaminase
MGIPLFAASLERYHARMVERMSEVAASGRFVLGPEVERFERDFADYLGVPHVVGVGNGTDALTIALRALGIGAGDEVICPSLTFYATAEAIVNADAVPVFCDVDPDTWCITAETVRPCLTDRTRAILPVHLFGNVAPVPELRELGPLVLEDVAQAAGATLDGVKAGGLADAATFSFFPSKNLPCLGDGGAIATHSDDVAERARILRFHGSRDKRSHSEIGYNSRLDAIQAAVLGVLLPELDGWNATRRELAAEYESAGVGRFVTPPAPTPGAEHVFHMYVVRADEPDALIARLGEAGVEARGYYRMPVHKQPPMLRFARQELPVTDLVAAGNVALPMGPQMPAGDVSTVVDACAELVSR